MSVPRASHCRGGGLLVILGLLSIAEMGLAFMPPSAAGVKYGRFIGGICGSPQLSVRHPLALASSHYDRASVTHRSRQGCIATYTVERRGLRPGLQHASMIGDAGKFAEWLESNGAKVRPMFLPLWTSRKGHRETNSKTPNRQVSCSVAPTSGGRGLAALKSLKAGDEACLIPLKLGMMEKTALEALGSKVLSHWIYQNGSWPLLSMV